MKEKQDQGQEKMSRRDKIIYMILIIFTSVLFWNMEWNTDSNTVHERKNSSISKKQNQGLGTINGKPGLKIAPGIGIDSSGDPGVPL